MFYSQFILAKKGPLGTIWIAAHLERKLRKNQVADTDIGVSVDSILFPEVPIALRLSSHLLLGVVRIYSRKVNYLFHDCSEALLNIKQAFRSTAVDLPPEESTAPYHSITLPETFDLDDFELPDNAFLQGNFVDHHVSTREQITLQDTMEGMVFSTSQFGPDERFGDGDASQIGLDLDEDLFMDTIPSTGQASVLLGSNEDVDPQTSGHPETASSPMDIDGVENSENLSESLAGACRNHIDSNIQDPMGADDSTYLHGDQIQTPDLNDELLPCEPIEGPSADPDLTAFPGNVAHVASSDFVDGAQAPSTPGLMEGAIVAGVHEAPTLSLLRKNSLHDSMEGLTPEAHDNSHLEPLDIDSTEPIPDENFGSPVNALDSHVGDANHMDGPSNNIGSTSDVHPVQNMENESPCTNNPLAAPNEHLLEPVKAQNATFIDQTMEPLGAVDSCHPSHSLLSNADCQLGSAGEQDLEKIGHEGSPMPQHFEHPNDVDTCENPPVRVHVLQACSSFPNQPHASPVEGGVSEENAPNLSSEVGSCILETQQREASHAGLAEVQGDVECSGGVTATDIGIQQVSGAMPSEIDECLHNVTSKDIQLDASKNSDLPATETLLLAPEMVSELPNDLAVLSTTDKEAGVEDDGTVDRSQNLSGRKRRLMESTPILQNSSSAKLSGISRSKKSVDFIPEDDDVLASILVGRRTPALKMRPTPEVVSSKRPRMAPRSSLSKRKVLMDDTMVLNGDLIRQQLTNTEDIRRTRRKAPCTRHEIWMIQKSVLEDEIFSEPLFTGITAELSSLQKQMYPQTKTGLSLADSHNSLGVPKELEFSKGTELSKETGMGEMGEPITIMPERNDGAQEHAETVLQIENQHSESAIASQGCDVQEQELLDVSLPYSPMNTQLQEFIAVEVDLLGREDNDVANQPGIAGAEMPTMTTQQSEDGCNMSTDSRIESSYTIKNNEGELIHENELSCSSPGHKSVVHSVDEPIEMNNETLHLTENFSDGKDDPTKETAAVTCEAYNGTSKQDEDASIGVNASNVEEIKRVISVEEVSSLLPQECHVGFIEISIDGESVPVPDNWSVETGTDMFIDTLNPVGNSDPSLRDFIVESGEPGDMANDKDDLEGIRISELENVVDGEPVSGKVANDEIHSSQLFREEGNQMDSNCLSHVNRDLENLPSNEGEDSNCKGVNNEPVIDGEMPVAGEFDDFDPMLDENDTDFLNVDDEVEPVEEDDNSVPGAEEDRFIENSGWSSRTRAVARYLQSLFDKEAGRGRKYVAMDNLLVGKTRKEASRMFFETLVLKTKDYIHVEQPNPLDNVSILPTMKLIKSEF